MKQNDEMPLLFNNDWRNWVFIAAVGLVGFAMLFVGLIALVQDIINQL